MDRLTVLGAAMALSAALVACEPEGNTYAPPPPPEVTVATPLEREVQDAWTFTGTAEAVETVELRPRVQGYLHEVHFAAGDLVKQGQILFTIDPRPFEAEVAQAEAQLAARRAELDLARVNVQRVRQIVERGAGNELELREREAQFQQAQAAVALAEATLTQAKLDLEWSRVTAPIDGRISRNLVDRGALVSPETRLATIVNDEQIYVYFNSSEREMLEYLRMSRPDLRTLNDSDRNERRKVYMGLMDEPEATREGEMDSADPQVDSSTGTIQARAVFDNPNRFIVPGSFVRIRLPKGSHDALLVPEIALGQDQGGRFVAVVNDENKVERRAVTVGPQVGQMRAVSGLAPTDRVVINGMQRARPGAEVKPVVTSLTEGAVAAAR